MYIEKCQYVRKIKKYVKIVKIFNRIIQKMQKMYEHETTSSNEKISENSKIQKMLKYWLRFKDS